MLKLYKTEPGLFQANQNINQITFPINRHSPNGKKNLALHGKAKELFLQKGYTEISVSISHTEMYSTAVVVLYCK